MNRPARLPIAACLLACPLGQACSPLIYEIAGEMDSESHTHPGDTTEPTGPSDPTGPDLSEGPGPTSPPPACDDGIHNGPESDVDCGGPCGPCTPGQHCDEPKDCDFSSCIDFTCQKVECTTPKDCPPPDPCMDPLCTAEGKCVGVPLDGLPCDDADPCSLKGLCMAGKCVPLATQDCSSFDGPCRAGLCNPQTGSCAVEWLFEGEPCKDEGGCSFFAQCTEGECIGKQPPGSLLFTDFSLAGGWAAEPPWSLGPAVPSKCSLDGKGDDPADDHSPSADGHVAGAAIGDCLPVNPFSQVCLESPPIDVMFMPGELWLTYWSVLKMAGKPMEARIDVHDGKDLWLPLLVIAVPTLEPDWTEHSIELTPFKSPALRIRFCHTSAGASDPVGGWSIDDLSVGPPQCL